MFDFLYFCKCLAVFALRESDGTSCGYWKVSLSPLITILINANAFRVLVSGQQIRSLQFEAFRQRSHNSQSSYSPCCLGSPHIMNLKSSRHTTNLGYLIERVGWKWTLFWCILNQLRVRKVDYFCTDVTGSKQWTVHNSTYYAMQEFSGDKSNKIVDSAEEKLGEPWLYVTKASLRICWPNLVFFGTVPQVRYLQLACNLPGRDVVYISLSMYKKITHEDCYSAAKVWTMLHIFGM